MQEKKKNQMSNEKLNVKKNCCVLVLFDETEH